MIEGCNECSSTSVCDGCEDGKLSSLGDVCIPNAENCALVNIDDNTKCDQCNTNYILNDDTKLCIDC